MDWVYYVTLLVVIFFGWFANILGLPGLWLMVGAHAAYGWLTGWNHYVGWPSLIAVVVLALLAEGVEFVAGAAGSAAAGGRKRGMIGAIVGGFLGAIFLSVIPIPIVAQVIGACLGAFIGAAVMELSDKDLAHSMRVGYGAAKGRLWGIISKLAFGAVMFVVTAWAALPLAGRGATASPPALPPGLPPATLPAPSTLPITTMPSVEEATIPITTAPATLPLDLTAPAPAAPPPPPPTTTMPTTAPSP